MKSTKFPFSKTKQNFLQTWTFQWLWINTWTYSFHMMNISTIQQNYQRAPDYFINPSFKYDAFPPPILYKSFTWMQVFFISCNWKGHFSFLSQKVKEMAYPWLYSKCHLSFKSTHRCPITKNNSFGKKKSTH